MIAYHSPTVPGIVEDPQSILVGGGGEGNASFTCTAYGGPVSFTNITVPLVFRWNAPTGVNISNVMVVPNPDDGRVSSVLTLTNTTVEHEGDYNCSVAYSDLPSVLSYSEIATLTYISKSQILIIVSHRTI